MSEPVQKTLDKLNEREIDIPDLIMETQNKVKLLDHQNHLLIENLENQLEMSHEKTALNALIDSDVKNTNKSLQRFTTS